MKALTVKQPWAWSIIQGGKDVENRTTAWKYRGPLVIHAGRRVSDRGMESPLYREALGDRDTWTDESAALWSGRIIGIVELVDLHPASPGCCESPWGEEQYVEHGGRLRRQLVHLVLEEPRAVEPVPCNGALGLWDVPDDIAAQVRS